MSRKKIKDGTKDVDIQYYYTEVTNENVNKWTAIEYLLEKLNISEVVFPEEFVGELTAKKILDI